MKYRKFECFDTFGRPLWYVVGAWFGGWERWARDRSRVGAKKFSRKIWSSSLIPLGKKVPVAEEQDSVGGGVVYGRIYPVKYGKFDCFDTFGRPLWYVVGACNCTVNLNVTVKL